MPGNSISVIILTKNEERDIANCLKSVDSFDDIHVLDSYSTDQTVDIAYQNGASVSFQLFNSFGQQRNYALDNLDIKNNWILFLDADEVASEKFCRAVIDATQNAGDEVAGFYCCWKMMLEERWLKHCDNFPKWQLRLVRKGRARFRDFGHGQKEDKVIGQIKYIRQPYLHYCFSKGWFHWVERHNRYSTQEAVTRLHNCPPFKNVWSGNTTIRTAALKSWFSRVPGWPVLRFVHAYFINLGFLEGVPGLIYCCNICYYEFLIQIKMREIKNSETDVEKKRKYEKKPGVLLQ